MAFNDVRGCGKCPGCEQEREDVEFKTSLGDGDVHVCGDCFNEITEEEEKADEEEEEEEEEEEDNDNGRRCERCETTTCDGDSHYPHRLLWNSNITGKEICRDCVYLEDELEDCEWCGDTHHTEDKCRYEETAVVN